MAIIIEKIDKIQSAAIQRDKYNNGTWPELHRQIIDMDDLEWLCETLKELVYDNQSLRDFL